MKWANRLRAGYRFNNILVFVFLVSGIGYLLSAAAFADPNTIQKRDNEYLGPLDDRSPVRQGFTSRKSYLARVELFFDSRGYAHKGEFGITVQLENETGEVVAANTYEVPESPEYFELRLSFQPQHDSLNKKYIVRITTNAPPGMLSLLGSDYDSYTGGEFSSGTPPVINGDLAFYTYSRPPPALIVLDTIRRSSGRIPVLLLMGLAYLGMGALIASYFVQPDDILEIIGFSLAIGLAIPPVVLFLLSLSGIKLPMDATAGNDLWFLPVAGLLAAIYAARRAGWSVKRLSGNILSRENFILALLFVLACFTRLAQINDILVPNGVGSFIHFQLMERIIRNGSMPLDSIYHLGFHSNALFVNWLTSGALPESTLLFGVFLSCVSGISFHLLARRVFKDVAPALIATGFYWFISPVPAALINGDRLPFLQGMTLLPAALALLWDAYLSRRANKMLGGLLLTGMFLSHFGTVIVLACLLPAVYIYETYENEGFSWRLERGRLLSGLLWTAPVALIVLAKLYFVIQHGAWGQFIQVNAASASPTDYDAIFKFMSRNGGWILWSAGLPGLAVLIRQNSRLLPMIFFSLLTLIGLNLLQVLLTGHSVSRPKNIIYFLSIPLCLATGYALNLITSNNRRINTILLSLLFLAGSYNITSVVEPRNIFYSRADQKAITWLNNHVPPGSTILINSYPFDGTYDPTDGGGWIPHLTGSMAVFAKSSEDNAAIDRFAEQSGAEYIYIGSGYGDLTPVNIDRIPNRLLYFREGIYIYQVLSP